MIPLVNGEGQSASQMLEFTSWLYFWLCVLNKLLSLSLPIYFYARRAGIYNTYFTELQQGLNEYLVKLSKQCLKYSNHSNYFSHNHPLLSN